MLNIVNLTINNLTACIVGICVAQLITLGWLLRRSKQFDRRTKWVPKAGKVSRIVDAKLSAEVDESLN